MKLNRRTLLATLLATSFVMALPMSAFAEKKIVMGFSQIGAESEWRTANTNSMKTAAKDAGIEMKFSDAQQKQENQIKAIRGFIEQGVDAILLAPVVATGWQDVLTEAQEAGIPVVLLDRGVDSDPQLFLASVASDQIKKGRVAGQWLVDAVNGAPCRVVELQGTVESTLAINRKKGFEQAIASAPNVSIVRSQTGEFTRSKGKEVMEGMLRAAGGGRSVCTVYAHNDDMVIAAI